MKRKLVRQGAATLMVSLPAKWLKTLNLGKGDEIDVEEIENSLVITKEGTKGKKEAEINLTTQTDTGIITVIINAYRAGYDTLRVRFESKAQFDIIKNAVRNYVLGYDITKKEKNSCVIESITDPSPKQFDALMNKIFFSAREAIELTKERLEGKKPTEDYREIALRIYQYDSFCRRVVAKRHKEVKDPQLFWTFQTLLVHGQRELYHLNRFLDKNKVKASKETISLMDDLLKLFNTLVNGYAKKDISYLERVHEMEKSIIYKKAYSIISRKSGKECVALHCIMDSTRNFYLATSPLMGLLLGV